MPTEADTCRTFVVPKLQDAGWDNEPHSIAEQHTITDGRVVPVGKGFIRAIRGESCRISMCNLYSITTNQEAIRALFRVVNRYVGNLAPMPGVFPDYPAPVIRNAGTELELMMMRWGMPPPPRAGNFLFAIPRRPIGEVG
jgi:hypothetical protein